MKDDRIREIVQVGFNDVADMDVDVALEKAIRLALAERDREIAEWAKQEEETVIHLTRDEIFQAVGYQALLAFLEAQP